MTSVVEWGAFVELDKDGWYAMIVFCQRSHIFTVTICCQVCTNSRFRGACVKTTAYMQDWCSVWSHIWIHDIFEKLQISDTFVENIEEYICPGQRVEVN